MLLGMWNTSKFVTLINLSYSDPEDSGTARKVKMGELHPRETY